MEIEWYGLGCVRLTDRGLPAVVTDPFDESEVGLRLPRASADIVACSQLMDDPFAAHWPGLRGVGRTIASPGEYEIAGVFVTGIASVRAQRRGSEKLENVIYIFSIAGVTVCHLGELGRPTTQAQVEAIGRVNALLLPVGIPGGLTASTASETISLIEPDIVIPIQYQVPGMKIDRKPVTGFLKEMGVTNPTPMPSLRITSDAASEEMQIVLLEPRN